MEAYLVRLKADHERAGEIVGIFTVDSPDDLFWMVDECCSPIECEYRPLGPGGIFWPEFTGVRVPHERTQNGERPDNWTVLPDGGVPTDNWEAYLSGFGDDDTGWKPVEWADDAPEIMKSLG